MEDRREKELLDREKQIEDRLQELNKRHGRKQPEKSQKSLSAGAGYGNAFRLSSEFISAILVGSAIGFAIDWLAGTSPLALIVFFMLGFVAGVLNVLRASGELSSMRQKPEEAQKDESDT